MHKYHLEFILSIQNASLEIIKDSITEFGEELEIIHLPKTDTDKAREIKIRICTEDPTIIFDTCAQFGRLKSVKVSETQTYGTK